jgi:hypothetical protein
MKAFQKRISLQWLANARHATNFDLVIPAGERLVIHEISGTAFMPADVKLTSVEVITSVGASDVGANPGAIFVAPKFVGSEDGPTNVPDKYVFSERVLAFAEGPNPAQILAARTPAAVPDGQPQGEVDFNIFGYLVDTIANSAGVTAADNPARQPFQQHVFAPSFRTNFPVFTVPNGKRLVVDFVSAEGIAPTGQTVTAFVLAVRDRPGDEHAIFSFAHVIGPTSHGPGAAAGQDLFIASQQMELFVDPGKELIVNVESNCPQGQDPPRGAHFFISGHLVNLP